jgi:DNA (cytosine-5)-methyltransferase 1
MGAGKDIAAWDAWTDKMRAAHANGNGHGKSLDIEVRRLLPTPKANDNHHSSPADLERHDPGLRALPQMLPTPRATDGPNQRGTSGDLMLPSAVQPERWGVYAEAIARAEQVFGPAPHPVETAADGSGYGHTCATGGSNRAPKDGASRLSCRFDEWLMGLPAGWVTDVPEVTHAEALKMCGNGVVPAQAALAIRICLDRARSEAAA